MTATATTIVTRIARVRELRAKERGVARNLRLGRYQGRNSAATDAMLAEWAKWIGQHEVRLLLAGQKEIVGLLTAEAKLAVRVQDAKLAGDDRPELHARLAETRRALRAAIKEVRS